MNIRNVLVGLGVALLVGGCSTFAPGSDDARVERPRLELPGRGTDCVFGSVRDFTVLDDHALLLYTAARSRAYYVEVTGVCIGLDTAFQIGFEGRDDRICGFGMDKIVLPGGSFTEKCPIGAVYELKDGDIAMVLAHYGRAKVEKAPEKEPETEQ